MRVWSSPVRDPTSLDRMDTELVIAGAGPTGLVLALWLARFRIRIIDRSAEPGTTSRAVAVQARTLELYRQLAFARDGTLRRRKEGS